MTAVPAEAVTAAAEAIGTGMVIRRPPAQLARDALEAAWPAIRAQVIAEVTRLARDVAARYDETKPCSCGRTFTDGSPCVVLLKSGLPFAGLIGQELKP